MRLKSVAYKEKYTSIVQFEDKVKSEIDLTALVSKGIFKAIKDIALFEKVYHTSYSIAWNDDLEIDALNIYLALTGNNLEEIREVVVNKL